MAYLRFRSPESAASTPHGEPDINPRLTAPLRDPPQSVPAEKGRVVTSKYANKEVRSLIKVTKFPMHSLNRTFR
ncbi:hypothetical protein TNIN_422162 [Trichonephila inaurata madagascariensis]|uniref:Uncharacterized protein n=1 Tax=Trichonephila inaurata madagascariensis TaxID=2747483 RepID=A0A8X6YXT5_9ARAC|nr:hypothetical protein TNIN_422162 [Trichonephila inaurata madagascariensis]